nr:protein pr [Lammi virus]
ASMFTRDGKAHLNVSSSDVGKWLQIKTAVGNGTCIVTATDVGSWCADNVRYLCPRLDNAADPDDVDCWCNIVSVYVTYGRCKRESSGPRRGKR